MPGEERTSPEVIKRKLAVERQIKENCGAAGCPNEEILALIALIITLFVRVPDKRQPIHTSKRVGCGC